MEFDTTLYEKRPDDRLDFDIDFARWLPAGDKIASLDEATVAEGSTVTVDEDDTIFTDTTVKVFLEGGEIGETATVTVQVTTTQGRTKEVCFKVRVRGCS